MESGSVFWKNLSSLRRKDTMGRILSPAPSVPYTFKCFHNQPNNDLHLIYTQLLTLVEHLAESGGGDGANWATEPSVLVTGPVR